MRRIAMALVFVTSICYARHCPDSRLQRAVIGGDTIGAFVHLHDRPLKFAQVQLFFFKWHTRLDRYD